MTRKDTYVVVGLLFMMLSAFTLLIPLVLSGAMFWVSMGLCIALFLIGRHLMFKGSEK